MDGPLPVVIACLVFYALGFGVYAKFLAGRIFRLDAARPTPAHTLRDEIDYVPTNRFVLFGHHFASITGLAPMLGPAVAVIWGWLPAMLWVVLGAVLVGCVHDFGALVVSMRARGQSIGKVAEGVIGPRAKSLFLGLIFFGVALAMGVFVFVIAKLFQAHPIAIASSDEKLELCKKLGVLKPRDSWWWRLLGLGRPFALPAATQS